MLRYEADASLPTQLHLTRHANPVTDVDLEPRAAHRSTSVERTNWGPEVWTRSPAHCCRHQAVAPRCAEYISCTGRHMLPDVTESSRQGSMPSLQTERWQVMTEPTGSQASNETDADRDASLLARLCGIAALGQPDMMTDGSQKSLQVSKHSLQYRMVRKILLKRLWPDLCQPQQLPHITAMTGCHLHHILLSFLNQKLSALLHSDSDLQVQLHFVRLRILLQSLILDS